MEAIWARPIKNGLQDEKYIWIMNIQHLMMSNIHHFVTLQRIQPLISKLSLGFCLGGNFPLKRYTSKLTNHRNLQKVRRKKLKSPQGGKSLATMLVGANFMFFKQLPKRQVFEVCGMFFHNFAYLFLAIPCVFLSLNASGVKIPPNAGCLSCWLFPSCAHCSTSLVGPVKQLFVKLKKFECLWTILWNKTCVNNTRTFQKIWWKNLSPKLGFKHLTILTVVPVVPSCKWQPPSNQ